ncbi:hypothetical protein BJX64DRAFT_293952 [Aspergillus heterothallicus]
MSTNSGNLVSFIARAPGVSNGGTSKILGQLLESLEYTKTEYEEANGPVRDGDYGSLVFIQSSNDGFRGAGKTLTALNNFVKRGMEDNARLSSRSMGGTVYLPIRQISPIYSRPDNIELAGLRYLAKCAHCSWKQVELVGEPPVRRSKKNRDNDEGEGGYDADTRRVSFDIGAPSGSIE